MIDSVAALLSALRAWKCGRCSGANRFRFVDGSYVDVNCKLCEGTGLDSTARAVLAAWETRPALRSYDALILPIIRRTDADEVSACHLLDELEKLLLGRSPAPAGVGESSNRKDRP